MTFAILPFADYEGNMRLTIFNSDCNGGITVAFATKQYNNNNNNIAFFPKQVGVG